MLLFLICLSIPLTATAQVVDIPDSNLRAAIEGALGKVPSATITRADMETLTYLTASNANISDLTGLEHATNLTWLRLGNNNISDISALAGLTHLTILWLYDNSITDISPLAGLTNLTQLWLHDNSITDISPLVANIGLGNEDGVALRGNLLNALSINTHIPALQSRGVTVVFDNIIVRPEDIAQTVNIPDPNLRAAIADERGKVPSDPITMADMVVLTQLRGYHFNISDLTGLEAATNLTQLELGDNSITDISPLAGLTNLTQLGLGDNSITDISLLAGLTNLTRLWLNNNSITDISPLAGLTNLTQLWLNNNSITDISPLVENTGLGNEDFVDVEGNPLSALSINTHIPTLHRRRVVVEFDDTGIAQPEDLAQTVDIPDPAFRAVIEAALRKVSGDPITVAEMKTLVYLYFANTEYIIDLTGLEHATNLKVLNLRENSISDISPLAGLTNLTELDLTYNRISDVSPLAGLTNLTELWLWDNVIADISSLTKLTNLTVLIIGGNPISDISAVAGLTNLTALGLENNSISDISALAGLTQLTTLWLENNPISDISPLAGLTNLITLSLWNNSIFDISPLVENTGLGNGNLVDVRSNPLNFSSINTHIPALQSRGVEVWFDDTVAQPADVNSDGVVNILDLVSVAAQFGKQGQNLAADVNGDGIVNILDLVLVAGVFGDAAAAPSAQPQAAEILSAAAVRQWLADAKALEIRDPIMERGVVVLQQLLVSLTPTVTELLANYPNPFNPETWIPYRLADDAFVTLTIYDQTGRVVRTIDVGHQTAAFYESRSQAIHWDGRNQIGETVASGVYFYHLSAGDYSATRKMLILK